MTRKELTMLSERFHPLQADRACVPGRPFTRESLDEDCDVLEPGPHVEPWAVLAAGDGPLLEDVSAARVLRKADQEDVNTNRHE